MKRQTRPFTTEIKQRRRYKKGSGSIWGDIDLSAAVAETARHFPDTGLQTGRLIDSSIAAANAEYPHKPGVEHHMANPLEADSTEVGTEPASKAATTDTKKRAPKARRVKAETRQPTRKTDGATSKTEAVAATGKGKGRKVYSQKERDQKLAQIEKLIGRGGTLKAAVQEAGITEQSYYHWKKAAAGQTEGDDLKDLLTLEEENKRLKRLLAERLRKENAELKKRLGL